MFVLDRTIEGDSHAIGETGPCILRLIDDARYPWVVVVPRRPDLVELHDLSAADFGAVLDIVRRCGMALQSAFGTYKINTAALGNAVRQLHIHVIGRSQSDAAWPKPVWGIGDMQRMADAEAAVRIEKFLKTFGL